MTTPDFLAHDPTPIDAASLGLKGFPSLELLGPLPERPRLAVIGSRAAHLRFMTAVDAVVDAAVECGWSLVSGGAIGIDANVHAAALRRSQPQVAVLPCGRDQPYPSNHLELFAAMHAAPEAALLFAQPPGTPTSRGMFVSRNRIVVALADAMIVVEASLRSGSIGTGRLARRRGVPVAAFAGSSGCATLIAEGADSLPEPRSPLDALEHARLRERVLGWLCACSGGDSGASATSSWPAELVWLRDALLDAGPRGATLDRLPNPGFAALGLCEAELLGLAAEASPGRWIVLER